MPACPPADSPRAPPPAPRRASRSATKPGSRKRRVELPAVADMSQLPAHMLLGSQEFKAPRLKRAG